MPIFVGPNSSDEYYTPRYAVKLLLPFLPRRAIIWEAAFGTGWLADHLARARTVLTDAPYRVVDSDDRRTDDDDQ